MYLAKPIKLFFVRFAKGKKPGQGTGFDINDTDLLEMEECDDVVVASAIFGINALLLMLFFSRFTLSSLLLLSF